MVDEAKQFCQRHLGWTIFTVVAFLSSVTGLVVNSLQIKRELAFGTTPPAHLMGWAGPEEAKKAWEQVKGGYPKFKIANAKESSEGKVVKLWDQARKANDGKHIPTRRQLIGDCVGAGHTNALDYLQCVADGSYKPVFENYHYACGRVIVGKGQIRGPDGSVGAWQVEALKLYGMIPCELEGLPEYSEESIREWAVRKPADKWIKAGKEHLLGTAAQVTTYSEARDAIANGYPVTVCSNRGFQMQSKTSGGKHWGIPSGQWNHCMCFIGVDDTVACPSFAGGGKGALYILNTWGPDAHGAPAGDEPPGGFWVSSKVADSMLAQEDSFALSDLVGFPARDPDWNFSAVRRRRDWLKVAATAMFAVGL